MPDAPSREYLLKIEKLKALRVARTVGEAPGEQECADLRRERVSIPGIWNALPEFVRPCSTIRAFWSLIKPMFETGKCRRRTLYV